jgi:hypothetical protein
MSLAPLCVCWNFVPQITVDGRDFEKKIKSFKINIGFSDPPKGSDYKTFHRRNERHIFFS